MITAVLLVPTGHTSDSVSLHNSIYGCVDILLTHNIFLRPRIEITIKLRMKPASEDNKIRCIIEVCVCISNNNNIILIIKNVYLE